MRLLLLTLGVFFALALSAQTKTQVFQMETIAPGYYAADLNGDGFNEIIRLKGEDMYVVPGTVTGQSAADTSLLAVLALIDTRIDQAVAGSTADLAVAGGNLGAGGTTVPLTDIAPVQGATLNGTPVTPNGSGILPLTDTDTQLSEAEVDAFVGNNGYLLVEQDGSTTNELQDPTYNTTTGALGLSSSGTTVDLSPLKNLTSRVDVDAFTATAGQTSFTLPFTPTEGEVYMRNGLPLPESQWSRTGVTLTLSVTPALKAGEVIGYDFRE